MKWRLAMIDDLLIVATDSATPDDDREVALSLLEEMIAVCRELAVASADVRTARAALRSRGVLV
jgi:hypothetical protein